MNPLRIIELTEYQPVEFESGQLSREVATSLRTLYSNQVRVERLWYESDSWRLTSQGWVGYIPLAPDVHLALQPKVSANLFGMLELAYQVGEFLPKETVKVESLRELYERLSLVLAQRVLDRGRKGFYRSYVSLEDQLPYVRGRLDMRRAAQTPWDARLHCQYQEHTADVEDNQILAWTMYNVARSGLCTERSLPTVRQAFRQVGHLVSLEPKEARCCLGRFYHRLNSDYASMHALCRFFLENSGPVHRVGESAMVPFLIDMDQLFEKFVAEWLRRHQPSGIEVKAHEGFTWDKVNGFRSDIDLVLLDTATSRPLCVLDTKYKGGPAPASDDVHQVVFYAQGIGCHEAILIYPEALAFPSDTWIGDIHLRTLTFSMDGNLDRAGDAFLTRLRGILGV